MSSTDATPVTARETELTRSTLNFPVVGIGASAGGMETLFRFFEQMPRDNGMAFVVILHLSPEHVSSADKLLQGVTKMPVLQVTETTGIEANHVYVIAPGQELSMNDSYLRVAPMERPRGRHITIDSFFRSLAVVHRERSIGIVLSGTGSDGAIGIARVKEQGGVAFAQDPDDAQFDGMPRAAIGTGMIDWVLPAVEMAQKLVDLWANARMIELPKSPDDDMRVEPPPTQEAVKQAEDALRQVMATLRTRTGHDFRHYKRATVLRRLERRLQVNSLPNLPAYREYLDGQPREAQALLKDLLIGVTNFFRDRVAFEALEREAVPQIFGALGNGPEQVRAWVAGCSTGEEAYSVAMLLAERAAETPSAPLLQVFGSDIDEQAIATARAGTYPASIVADVPPSRLRQWFTKEDERYRVRKELRERVLFAAHNLLRDPPFSRLDLICCRNLLIYIDRAVHARILETFHFSLKPGGFLFLGSAETAEAASHLFTAVDKKHRLYRANDVGRVPLPLPALPLGTLRTQGVEPQDQSERRKHSYADVHRTLVEQYAPPSALVDGDGNIVHLSEQAGRFLRHVAGAPSHHLVTLVQPELRLELRTALYQALQLGKSVEARRVQIERDDGRHAYINIIVRPVPAAETHRALVLVLFDEVEVAMSADTGSDGTDPMLAQLEDELRRSKGQLQATVERSEASNEELKASNEELQSINEELRSASEELETSKEELQSINEELITVNNELKSKVEETDRVNDDLRNLVTATDVATVFIDRTLAIKRFTPRAAEIFSIIAGDVGRPLLDITHRLDYPALADDAGEAFQSLRTIEREVQSSDGRWYLARVVPYRTTADRIDGAVLSFIDITARRQAEEHGRMHEALMRTVADSARDFAIITCDLDGRITSWNSGAERLFGHTPEQAIGQRAALLFTPADRAAGVPEDEMRRAREDGRAEDDRWHLRRDGTRVFVSGIMTPLRVDGALRGYAKIARDMTGERQREADRDLALTQESADRVEAQAANTLKDEFLAVMSHELKNPLNLIQLNAELLSRLPEARAVPSVARAAGIIRKTVISQARIIDDLLDLSRISTGKLRLNPAPVDWGAMAQGIVSALADEAAKKSLAIGIDFAAEPVIVHADPVRVEQIVWNLLSNALKFTPEGGSIAVRLRSEGGCGVLEVRDSGCGIAPELLPKLFNLFQQADVRNRQHGGLGIGLALVKHLAEMQHGRVQGASDGEGRGATFTVWLPLRRSVEAQAPAAAGGAGQLAGRRALIVDDDAPSVETLRQLLEVEGLQVTIATDARRALDAVARQRFDVIVSDIAMPGMDGYQLVEALKAGGGDAAATPTVAMTGFGRPADVKRALGAGFNAHLSKPVPLERLVETLLEVLTPGPTAQA